MNKSNVSMARLASALFVTAACGIPIHGISANLASSAPINNYTDRLDIPSAISPIAVKSSLTGIARAGNSFVAVGEQGHILLSTDHGKNWVQANVPLSSPLIAVTFPTPQRGWAVGHDGVVLHSDDGGKHWVRQLDGRKVGDMMVAYYEKLPPASDPGTRKAEARALEEAKRFRDEGASKPFFDVYFENDQSGWVIGAFNMILKTADGGNTWQPWIHRTDNDNGYSLHALARADGDLYIVGELGLLLKLDRKENRFAALKSPYVGSLFGVTGKPGTVLIYGLRGNLFRSRDKGRTWQTLRHEFESALVGATYLEDGRLVMVSNNGDVLVSKDDGDSFISLPIERRGMLSAVAPVNADSVLIVGAKGVSLLRLEQ